MSKPKSPTKHGGFEAIFLKKKDEIEKEKEKEAQSYLESHENWMGSTMSPKSGTGKGPTKRRR